MSIHSSLKSKGTGVGERNVWTRVERLAALRKLGEWTEGDAVEGLRKVRTRFKAKGKKKKAAASDDKEK